MQLQFAPIFLGGWLLSGGGLTTAFFLAFFALHLFLYSGAAAFNSYYDRDEGPIAGIEHPPPVIPALLPLALAMKGIGGVLAALVNLPFFLAHVGYLALSLAYSHPLPRLKARPVVSVLAVGVGQGTLVFLGAWGAVHGELASAFGLVGGFGALAATLLVLGSYPLTQLYQIEEDRARGDRTLAVAWGSARCFRLTLICQAIGGLALLTALSDRYGLGDVSVLGAGLLLQGLVLARWAGRFDVRQVLQNYRRVMRLSALTSGGLALYFCYRLVMG